MFRRHLRRQLEEHPKATAVLLTLLVLLTQATSTAMAGGGDPISGP